MEISVRGLNLIKRFEGLSLKPYICPSGHFTIGYGNTYYEDGTKVAMDDKPITIKRAEMLLKLIVDKFAIGVEKVLKVPLEQNQFDAVVSFSYNVGLGNLKSSTLLKKINDGKFLEASKEFGKWNKAKGKILDGLTKRREAERLLFIGIN
jgi:lysozyme